MGCGGSKAKFGGGSDQKKKTEKYVRRSEMTKAEVGKGAKTETVDKKKDSELPPIAEAENEALGSAVVDQKNEE